MSDPELGPLTVEHLGGDDPITVTVYGVESQVMPVNDPPTAFDQFSRRRRTRLCR